MRRTLKQKLADSLKAKPIDLIVHGGPHTSYLEIQGMIVGHNSRLIKKSINSMKALSSVLGIYSSSANQFALDHSLFIIARNLKDGIWMDRKLNKELDFVTYINPSIVAASPLEEYQWEYCASFPNIRANVKRFSKIKVNYFDEDMEEQEEDMEGFRARVFQHELDHLNGRHLLTWSVSEGEVEMLPQADMDFPNFKKALDEYKLVIEKKKKEFPEAFKKTVDKINLKNESSDPMYWDRLRSRETQFSEEDAIYQKLKKAIALDVKNFEESAVKNNVRKDPNQIY